MNPGKTDIADYPSVGAAVTPPKGAAKPAGAPRPPPKPRAINTPQSPGH